MCPPSHPSYPSNLTSNLECMSEQACALPAVPPTSLPPFALPVVVTPEKDGPVIKGSGVTVYGRFFAFDEQEIDLFQEGRDRSSDGEGLRPLLESFSLGKFAKLQTLELVIAR